MSEHLLSVKDLRTSFVTDNGEVHAVNGVSFNLDRGKVLGIVGESGSGKSVTAYSIMQILADNGRIAGGSVEYKGQDITKWSARQMAGFRGKCCSIIFQDPMTSLNPVFTIGNQLEEAILLHTNKNKAQAKERAIEMLTLVGVNEPAKRVKQYPYELSGGMRQRVMIAMALACEPDILIADEPTTALDVTIQAQILELMKDLQQTLGMAIILFETARRWIILQIIDSHEKKREHQNRRDTPDQPTHTIKNTSVVRIIVIGQEKMYLIENPGNKNEPISGSGLDVPLHHHIEYCTTQKEEEQIARQIVRQELHIADPDLRCLSSITSEDEARRVGHYILFLPEAELASVDRYPGRWYTVEEITRLFHTGKLYPLFKEIYARFYTVVDTARTYHRNGQRRFAIRGYKPAFTLRHLDRLEIEFNDPVWLYVSRHNEDRLSTRIHLWVQKILRKFKPSNHCNA